jgi:Zn-dependent M28 family amino/carboxypeptidase
MTVRHRLAVMLALLASLLVAVVPVGSAALPTDSSALRAAVDAAEIVETLEAFQAIADANGGTRASGTPGYAASVAYVVAQLEAAGYDPVVQEFEFPFFQLLSPGTLQRVSPDPETYTAEADFFTMMFSGSSDVTAELQPVNDIVIPPGPVESTSTAGCEPGDFAGFEAGNIALIQRGTCTFEIKVANAIEAGASAVILFNEGQVGRTEAFSGTLTNPVDIPVVMASFEVGAELYALTQAGEVVMRVATSTLSETRTTWNVIAELEGTRDDRTVVVGAHLDSVLEGPGIQDNGSGSATILEIAEEMAALGIEPTNTVRFIWFGAEESGLLGSEYYVSQLSKAELKDIAVMLNFDMIASPNYVRFVYDGDGRPTGTRGPAGSGNVEDVFLEFFSASGLPTEPTEFDGRSDYGPFIAAGIPSGGLFTGAEGIKTPEEQAIYGGTAGVPYDPCYHLACDTIDNINIEVLEQMADAAAHATLTFAMTQSAVAGTGQASEKAKGHGLYKGPKIQR